MKKIRFAKKMFFIGLTILSNLTNVNSLSSAVPLISISMKIQIYKTRSQFININSNNPI